MFPQYDAVNPGGVKGANEYTSPFEHPMKIA
jgi:hypothetical protein